MFDWVLNTPILNVFKVNNKDTTTILMGFALVFGYLARYSALFSAG